MSGCPFPEHHGSSGGSGIGTGLLVFLVAMIAAAAATPVVVAITGLIHVLVIIIQVMVPMAFIGAGAYAIVRFKKRGQRSHELSIPPKHQSGVISNAHQAELPAPRELHIHLHGPVSQADAAYVSRMMRESN